MSQPGAPQESVNEVDVKKVLQRRASAMKEAREKRKSKEEKRPKLSRLEQRREANKRAAEGAESDSSDSDKRDKKGEDKGKDGEEQQKTLFGSTTFKVVCLVLLVPVVVCVPFLLGRICALIQRLPHFVVPALWAVYGVVFLVILFGAKRHKATLDSVTTHHSVYGIFALGAYYLLHLAENVPLQYRRDSLKVWVLVTMPFNLLLMALDDTDYRRKERIEKERERREKERREKQEKETNEQRSRRRKNAWYNRNRYVRIAVDLLVYVAVAAALYFAVRAFQRYKHDFDQRVREGRAPNEERTWGYEGYTGADWKPDVSTEDVDSVHVAQHQEPQQQEEEVEWKPEIREEDLLD